MAAAVAGGAPPFSSERAVAVSFKTIADDLGEMAS